MPPATGLNRHWTWRVWSVWLLILAPPFKKDYIFGMLGHSQHDYSTLTSTDISGLGVPQRLKTIVEARLSDVDVVAGLQDWELVRWTSEISTHYVITVENSTHLMQTWGLLAGCDKPGMAEAPLSIDSPWCWKFVTSTSCQPISRVQWAGSRRSWAAKTRFCSQLWRSLLRLCHWPWPHWMGMIALAFHRNSWSKPSMERNLKTTEGDTSDSTWFDSFSRRGWSFACRSSCRRYFCCPHLRLLIVLWQPAILACFFSGHKMAQDGTRNMKNVVNAQLIITKTYFKNLENTITTITN